MILIRTILEVIIQTILAFFVILFLARIIGKKQIAELTFYDYVNGITFGSIAANMATDINQRTWQYLIGLFIFAFLTFLMQYITLKNTTARKIIEGEPVVLIHKGKILEDNLKKTRFNIEDLLAELRENNYFDIRDVHYAILENDGRVSVLPVADKKPLTPKDINQKGQEESIVTEIIIEGKIILPNLHQHGLDKKWLYNTLQKNNINEINDIMLAIYNPINQSIYFDLKNDNLQKDTVDISEYTE